MDVLMMVNFVELIVFARAVRIFNQTRVKYKNVKSKPNWGLTEVYLIILITKCQLRCVLALKVGARKSTVNATKQG